MKDLDLNCMYDTVQCGISVSIGHRTDNKSHEEIQEAFENLNIVFEDTTEAFMKFVDYVSEIKLTNTDKELLKRCVVISGRQHVRSTSNKQLKLYSHDTPKPESEIISRRCDCLKCRMGKPDQCTTYSPKKRRGK